MRAFVVGGEQGQEGSSPRQAMDNQTPHKTQDRKSSPKPLSIAEESRFGLSDCPPIVDHPVQPRKTCHPSDRPQRVNTWNRPVANSGSTVWRTFQMRQV